MNTDRLLKTLQAIDDDAQTALATWDRDRYGDVRWAVADDAGSAVRARFVEVLADNARAAAKRSPGHFCRWYAERTIDLIANRPWESRSTSGLANFVKSEEATATAWLLDRLSIFVDLVAIDPEE